MGTKERKYPSKYELLVQNLGLVDYVSMVNTLLAASKARQRHKDNSGANPLEMAIEFDLIQVHGARGSGRTLAIHELATLPTDLIVLKDLSYIEQFKKRQYHHSDAVFASTHQKLEDEQRADPERIRSLKESGSLWPVGEAGFVPQRIFVCDAYYHFRRRVDARSLFRWAQTRYGITPTIIAL